ncbi:MAG: hypothetical protein WC618_03995 [Patescibacteria group bacterium]
MKKKLIIFLSIFFFFYIFLYITTRYDVSEKDFLKNQEVYQELADAFYEDDEIKYISLYSGDIHISNHKEKYVYGKGGYIKENIYYKKDGYYISDDYNAKYSAEKIDYYVKLLKKSGLYKVYQPIGRKKEVWLLKKGWVNKYDSSGYIYDPTGEYTIDNGKPTLDIKLNDYWHTVNRLGN